jgi:AcrR family transcriptional regulator
MRRQKHTDQTSQRSEHLPEHPEDAHQDAAALDTALEAIAKELANPREIMRLVRQAGRDAIREAHESTLEVARQAREHERETARQAREVEREMARQLRESHTGQRGDRGREPGEPDTRSRIQQVALELFTENGYEATSLREIAERLGVTKAALYYHFKTKDDIIESLVHDRLTSLENLIVWAEAQPRTVATRREALRRYSDMLHEQHHRGLMRCFERNQSSMAQLKAGATMRERMMQMQAVLSGKDAPLQDQIRCSLAIFALHSVLFFRDPQATDEQRREAALEVALELVDRPGNEAAPGNEAKAGTR